jgi:hypothetical protein
MKTNTTLRSSFILNYKTIKKIDNILLPSIVGEDVYLEKITYEVLNVCTIFTSITLFDEIHEIISREFYLKVKN